jgi:uncharacterized protein YjbJ (UPF0337 family)
VRDQETRDIDWALQREHRRAAGVVYARPIRTAQVEEVAMDWNRVEGNWKQLKGKVKEQWGKLTDDDLDTINGRREQLEGKIQERYGYQKDQAQRDVDTWYNSQKW